jgi:hypothetical protein
VSSSREKQTDCPPARYVVAAKVDLASIKVWALARLPRHHKIQSFGGLTIRNCSGRPWRWMSDRSGRQSVVHRQSRGLGAV